MGLSLTNRKIQICYLPEPQDTCSRGEISGSIEVQACRPIRCLHKASKRWASACCGLVQVINRSGAVSRIIALAAAEIEKANPLPFLNILWKV